MSVGTGTTIMKARLPEPQISADEQSFTFVLLWGGEAVTCVVLRAALEMYFWLAANADDARS
jgi:hypothetical protein